MHGREGEISKRSNRHMLTVPSRALTPTRTTTVIDGDSKFSASANYFFKEDRKISVGDCALFRPSIESPPFIGIICSLISDKENNLKLGVNWLYRPSEAKLGKGVALEAAPNEVFYSFHRDEIPAASILHPCKVAFLPKGVELPCGVFAFVCRRVYDVEHECLWWLTDKDYMNERQEEVDQLLQKTRREMHASVQHQQGTRSPKPVNGSTAMSPSKQSPDSMQNSSSFPSPSKGKKRDRVEQASESIKRERSSKVDDGESRLSKSDNLLKSEIAKMTEKGGLVDSDTVERLVQLMQPDKPERKVDLSCRSMLAGIIAATEKYECLSQFVQLKGLPVLDEWLQEAHKGKVGESSSPKDSDRSLEDFILLLLRALDKLPVNLNALQTCNIGKSVNHLRTHKNLEIQKKARILVDTWKKRVEAEMNMSDSRLGGNQGVPWSARSRQEVSHGSSRHLGGTSEAAMRSSVSQLSSSRSGSVKVVHGDPSPKPVSGSLVPHKSPSSPASATSNYKEGQTRIPAVSGSSEPQPNVKEEKSSSSSQSHTNSQCSSDHAKNIIPSGKEDARSSTARSKSMNKITGSASRHRKSANGVQPTAASTVHRESSFGRHSSSPKTSPSEKFLHSINSEHAGDASATEGNNHKLIVKITNRGRSPAQGVNGGAGDPSNRNSRASSPAHSEKHDQAEASLMRNVVQRSNEGDDCSAAAHDRKNLRPGNDPVKVSEGSKSTCLTSTDVKTRKPVDSSLNSINAFIESCMKYSEANASISVGDAVGMNLLASVAAGEMSNVAIPSPTVSPQRDTSLTDKSCADNDGISRSNDGEAGKCSQSSGAELKQDEEPCAKNEDTMDESGGETGIPVSPATTDAKTSGEDDQAALEKTTQKDEICDQLPDTRQIVGNASVPGDRLKNELPADEAHRNVVEDLMSCHSSIVGDGKNDPSQAQKQDVVVEYKPPAQVTVCMEEQSRVSPPPIKDFVPGNLVKLEVEVAGNTRACSNPDLLAEKRTEQDNDDSLNLKEEESCLCPSGSDQKNMCKGEILESKEPVSHYSNKRETHATPEKDPHMSSRDSNLIGSTGKKKDECASTAVENSSSSAAKDTDADVKVGFDLNEGLNVDDGKHGDPAALPAPHCPPNLSFSIPLQLSMSSASCSLPAPIAVAPAEGLYVPPEDLSRNKSGLGWKGSAATSAFRPAEPRKSAEMSLGSNWSPVPDGTAGKQVKFEFDLNMPDERVLQDAGCQTSGREMEQKLEPKNDCQSNAGSLGSASLHGSGGLDLDLNRTDDAPELGQNVASSGQRLDASVATVKSMSSIGPSNVQASARRDFDLNDGPVVDEVAAEPPLFNQHACGNILPRPPFGLRMNSAAIGNFPSWYSPGTTYSAVATPSPLPDRGEQPYPTVGFGGGAQRILAGPTPSTSLNPDVYRGSVLTSTSPAVAFQTPPFQYPLFPFGASFPLPASSLSGGSPVYMDPSSGGRLALPTQLLGSAASISTQYPRPCAVTVSDVSNNGGVDNSRRWARQGLDLNCGPGGLDAEGRDDLLPMSSRQFPAIGSQSLVEEQARMFHVASGGMKRKEPEGGWDPDRLSHKQSPWRQ